MLLEQDNEDSRIVVNLERVERGKLPSKSQERIDKVGFALRDLSEELGDEKLGTLLGARGIDYSHGEPRDEKDRGDVKITGPRGAFVLENSDSQMKPHSNNLLVKTDVNPFPGEAIEEVPALYGREPKDEITERIEHSRRNKEFELQAAQGWLRSVEKEIEQIREEAKK